MEYPLWIGVILDTETTGLDSTDRVLELGLLRFEFDPISGHVFRILDSYGALENPGIRISESSATGCTEGNRSYGSAVSDLMMRL